MNKERKLKMFLKEFDLKPVEVEPVRHGHWIDAGYVGVDMPIVCCSVCGIRFCGEINIYSSIYHYCPHCGARMDVVEE